jgi:hypothetical protein
MDGVGWRSCAGAAWLYFAHVGEFHASYFVHFGDTVRITYVMAG